MLNDKTILITGGTGSFGRACTRILLAKYRPSRLIVFSRDELKQFEMAQEFPFSKYPAIRYFLGDIRDKDRLSLAFKGVDVVIHAAALKQVPAIEYNPFEAVKTNILGAQNIITAALEQGVQRVIALSTDKAANPVNFYGATKLCSDKLFICGNSYARWKECLFSVVRYGNVVGSRGSVVPLFLKLRKKGVLPITDPRMTRFWITLEQAVEFVCSSLERMEGGEIFVPKIPSMSIMDLAAAIAPECRTEVVGIRPGEKLHEMLITREESRDTLELGDRYVIRPKLPFLDLCSGLEGCTPVPEHFEYSSDTNPWRLGVEEMRDIVAGLLHP